MANSWMPARLLSLSFSISRPRCITVHHTRLTLILNCCGKRRNRICSTAAWDGTRFRTLSQQHTKRLVRLPKMLDSKNMYLYIYVDTHGKLYSISKVTKWKLCVCSSRAILLLNRDDSILCKANKGCNTYGPHWNTHNMGLENVLVKLRLIVPGICYFISFLFLTCRVNWL